MGKNAVSAACYGDCDLGLFSCSLSLFVFSQDSELLKMRVGRTIIVPGPQA